MKEAIHTDNAPKAIGPYSQAIKVGDTLFISGQIAMNKDGLITSDNIEEQTLQCLQNIEAILKEANLSKASIVKTTIFLSDMNNFAKCNDVYKNFLDGTTFPARSTIEVSRLPKNALVEIEAIATTTI